VFYHGSFKQKYQTIRLLQNADAKMKLTLHFACLNNNVILQKHLQKKGCIFQLHLPNWI